MEPTLQSPAAPNPAPSTTQSKKKLIIGLAAAVLLATALVWWLLQSTNEQQVAEAADNAVAEISITDKGFTPAEIKIKVGQSVKWLNTDTQPHMIVADDPSADDFTAEEPLMQSDTYNITFERSGTYHYHDISTPTVSKGTIIVE